MLLEVMQEIEMADPVGGKWSVVSKKGRVWCDASSLAVGCALEVDDGIVEYGAWLRKADDGAHINMAELDSVLKGLNLATKWGLKEVEIVTDSATVHGWLRSAFFDSHRILSHGMNEMLIKRRLSVAKELCSEYGMQMNKADRLTRVNKKWLNGSRSQEEVGTCCTGVREEIEGSVQEIHSRHHLGIERTFFLGKKKHPEVSRTVVKKVVSSCSRCGSIDPAPVTWDRGVLAIDVNWSRVAADVAHYNGICYLSLVDCGPSRFMIWRRLRAEDANSIVAELEQLFWERGPPKELLMDNEAAFRSDSVQRLLKKWQVDPVFRCAYRPESNGIVERSHRTIKRMAARSNAYILDMIFWYNVTPKNGTDRDVYVSVETSRFGGGS